MEGDRLLARGHDWTGQFGAIAQAAKHLKARQAIFDGEAVVLASSGVADFHALRRELGKRNSDRLSYQDNGHRLLAIVERAAEAKDRRQPCEERG